MIKAKIPKIKKKISHYLLSEEGKISKQSLLTIGSILGGAILGAVASTQEVEAGWSHINELSLNYTGGTEATAEHSHHGSHSSY